METIAKDFVNLLQYLLPGFVPAWVLYSLTSFPRPSQFERVVQALIFTLFVHASVFAIKEGLFFLGNSWSLSTWDNKSYTIELIPRPKRWYGKLGLYHPQMRPPHENVVHMIAEEYQMNLSSYAEFNEFKSQRNGIYNDQGLYVEFVKREGPGAEGNIFVMVTISQIKINGENPEKLMGSANGKIIIKNGT